jgi:protein-S-isoprenylcysteine O-methyltransferase Ste14
VLDRIYWLFSYLGLMTVTAAFITGFRHDAAAPVSNVWFDIVLYAIWVVIHIAMTMPAFKAAVYGQPEGTPFERRVYMAVSVVTWLALYSAHLPVPGFVFDLPAWVGFVGLCGVLLSFLGFFEFATFESLGSLVGMRGAELSHSAGAETPLLKEGPYANVRHPMYRAFVLLALSSLLMHPHAGQLLFVVLVVASFVGFVPFEERQLVESRGEAYRAYMQETPYRLFRGIW